MHKYGDCSFCGGEVKEGRVELDYRYKEKLYIFQNVPAGVCQQCGKKYLTAEAAKKIEHSIYKICLNCLRNAQVVGSNPILRGHSGNENILLPCHLL